MGRDGKLAHGEGNLVSSGSDEPSDEAVDCFVHGLAHVIDELGPRLGIAWVAGVVLSVSDAGITSPPQRATSAQETTWR